MGSGQITADEIENLPRPRGGAGRKFRKSCRLKDKTAHRIYVHLNAKNCLVHGGRVNSELATPESGLVTRGRERIVPTPRPTPARRRSKEGAAAGGEGAGPLPTDLCGRACGGGGAL